MRLIAGLLIVVSAGVVSQAMAADPTPPSPAPSQTAPPPAEQPSAKAPAGEHGAVAPTGAQHAVTPAAPPKAASTEVTREDQDILSRGYKLEMRHGEKYFCRREGEIGSRFERKSCYTAAALEAQELASQEMTRRIQINTPQSGK